MNDKKKIKQKLIKNMILNLITFIIVFSIFDIIVYNQISTSIYKSIDTEIEIAAEQYNRQQIDLKQTNKFDNEMKNKPPEEMTEKNQKRTNPRLIIIIRNSNGQIINQNNIGVFYENYINEINFDKNNLSTIYSIKIEDTYSYRCYNHKYINENDEIMYVQILANVDAEEAVLGTIGGTLLIGSLIITFISIIASYILSKQTIKPIVESWEKQTEFVQNASHELRTPLTIIQTKQELLLQDPNAKIIDKSEDINISLKETRRLSKLIKELMILARSDSNKYELKMEQVEIDKIIKAVVEPYIEYAQTQGKKIELDLEFGKEINIDVNKISQVLIILLDNAIKYTSENDLIKISSYLKDGKCGIEITDTGIGISDEGLKNIFDRFYREDKARNRETGGNGLGLSIAKTIIDAHNGTIKAYHNEPKGTKFIIKI